MNRDILLLPIGLVDEWVLHHLLLALEKIYKCECGIKETLPVPAGVFDPVRKQYSGELMLKRLSGGKAGRVLGVADLDLYVQGLNFIFGLAAREAKNAIIALPRLRESFYGRQDDNRLFLARAVKEGVHELGHTYGLNHCQNWRCVMAFSNSLVDTDYKGQEFCPQCAKKICL